VNTAVKADFRLLTFDFSIVQKLFWTQKNAEKKSAFICVNLRPAFGMYGSELSITIYELRITLYNRPR